MKERHSTRALTIKNKVFRMKGVRISIKRARRARHMCLDDIFGSGSYERSFREIPDLCYWIRAQNPGSIACWKINRKTKEFEGLCIAYKASIDGFKNGCRPLIALDGFPLKTKFRGAVLTACSVDGKNAMFPVAIYICRTETLQAWRRFLTIIATSLKEFSKPITFFYDHEKGVNVAVAENFKDVVHHQRRCFRKMYKKEILTCIVNKSWDMQFSLESLAWKPPAAYNFKSFKRAMAELEITSVLARLELEIHPTETWARYAFDQSARCPHIFNIFSQSFQDWIEGLKCSLIVTWVTEYTKQLGDMFFHRRWLGCEEKMQEHGIVPQAARCVEIYLNWVTDCHVLPGDVAEHWSVTHGSYGTETVNLSQWHCSCGEWAETGIPCVHVLAVVVHQGRDDYDKAAYAGAIPCVPEINWKHVRGPKSIVKPPPMLPGYED
ncbi:hypothetical protein MKX03_016802 [Papaver bracteatum]|nr:hypothetical protein MKX03_016802 [Papaver bracteatum]